MESPICTLHSSLLLPFSVSAVLRTWKKLLPVFLSPALPPCMASSTGAAQAGLWQGHCATSCPAALPRPNLSRTMLSYGTSFLGALLSLHVHLTVTHFLPLHDTHFSSTDCAYTGRFPAACQPPRHVQLQAPAVLAALLPPTPRHCLGKHNTLASSLFTYAVGAAFFQGCS